LPDILDNNGVSDDRFMKAVEETVPVKPVPSTQTVYYFEGDSFQVRCVHGGHVVEERTTWTNLKSAIEDARLAMGTYKVTPHSTMVIEVLHTVRCIKRRRTGRTHTYDFPDKNIYVQFGYPKLVRSAVVWRSTAPDEECCIPVESGIPCGEVMGS
jgi:hypothetical protein